VDGCRARAQYVSEELNPENGKCVAAVEVFSPSRLLSDGMCFVDTPGLGSVFAGNTATTQAFAPHIDAAIVVLGADPPIAGEELALVGTIGKQVSNLVIVMNKADRTSHEERETARSFAKRMLEGQLGHPVGPIYDVSAEERLRSEGPERDWTALQTALENLVRESGRELVQSAAERGFNRLRNELFAIITEERDALVRPIEESEQRINRLRQTISEAELSLRDVNYLFMAEEHHLSDMFLAQRKQFLASTMPKVEVEFGREIGALPRRYGPAFRRTAFRVAQEVSERNLRPWLEAEQSIAEQEYRKVAVRFVNIGNNFLNRLAESGVPEFMRMPNALDPDRGFRVPSRFTFERSLHVAQPASPLRYIADVSLGIVDAYGVIEKEARSFLAHLMDMNSTRVQSDIINRVQESRGLLQVEIRKLLHEVSRVAEHALERARMAKAEGASAIQAALARLGHIESSLRSLSAHSKTETGPL